MLTIHMLIWIFCFLPWAAAQGTDYFMIEKMYMCDDIPKQQIKLYMTPKAFTRGSQIVDINITSPIPIGDNAQLKCVFYMEIRNRWVPVNTFEQDFCTIMKTYVGQLFYDLERAVGVMPGTCPIPRGSYHAVNYTFNFAKLKLQSFAFGRMKFRLEGHDKTTKEMRSCVIVIIQNGNGEKDSNK